MEIWLRSVTLGSHPREADPFLYYGEKNDLLELENRGDLHTQQHRTVVIGENKYDLFRAAADDVIIISTKNLLYIQFCLLKYPFLVRMPNLNRCS
jgi:hypothetical protein